MDCKGANKIFEAVLEKKVSEGLKYEFFQHLSACKKCSSEYLFLEQTYKYIGEQKKWKAQEFITDSVLKEIDEKRKGRFLLPMQIMIKVAAILILGLGIIGGVVMGNNLYKTEDYYYQVWADEFFLEANSDDISLETIFETTD